MDYEKVENPAKTSELKALYKTANQQFKALTKEGHIQEGYNEFIESGREYEALLEEWNKTREGFVGSCVNILEKMGCKLELKSFTELRAARIKDIGFKEALELKKKHEELLGKIEADIASLRDFEKTELGMEKPTEVDIQHSWKKDESPEQPGTIEEDEVID